MPDANGTVAHATASNS